MKYDLIPDWENLRRRCRAFWNNEVSDGAVIAHIQNPNPDQPDPDPWMLEASAEKYLNPEKFFKLQTWRLSAWNWHADLFKYRTPSIGPNVFAGCVGGKPGYGADTVWHMPVIKSLDEAEKIHFDEDNPGWCRLLEMVDYFVEACDGVEQLGMIDLGGIADCISTFMEANDFYIACLTDSDRMREFALRLAAEENRAFDLLHKRLACRNDGLANWMPIWSDKPMVTLADDVAVNLSPELYADVFIPALTLRAAHGGRSVLHWHDACSYHLDNILKIDQIDCIQLGHDPNVGPYSDKLPDMIRIQESGKKLFIGCCANPREARVFIDNLDPRGLIMIIDTASDEQSKEACRQVIQWTGQRMEQLGLV